MTDLITSILLNIIRIKLVHFEDFLLLMYLNMVALISCVQRIRTGLWSGFSREILALELITLN